MPLRLSSLPIPIRAIPPAWTVCAWPLVTCPVHLAGELALTHLGTRVLACGLGDTPATGHTVWGGASLEGDAGVAWDWVQIQTGVVAMADPFGLVTNLQLVGEQGRVLSHVEAVMRLNQIVHALPWQTEVQRALANAEH